MIVVPVVRCPGETEIRVNPEFRVLKADTLCQRMNVTLRARASLYRLKDLLAKEISTRLYREK